MSSAISVCHLALSSDERSNVFAQKIGAQSHFVSSFRYRRHSIIPCDHQAGAEINGPWRTRYTQSCFAPIDCPIRALVAVQKKSRFRKLGLVIWLFSGVSLGERAKSVCCPEQKQFCSPPSYSK